MKTLTLPLKDSDIDTRAKRRRVCMMIGDAVWRVYEAEYAYKERIPENLKVGYRYLYARVASESLFDACLALYETFEPF